MIHNSSSHPEFDLLVTAFTERRYQDVLDKAPGMSDKFADQGCFYKLLGQTHFCLGQYESAIEWLLEAAGLLPTDAVVFNTLGNALMNYGKPHEAIEAHQIALRLQSDSSAFHSDLGQAYLAVGARLLALEQLWLAFDLNPESREVAAWCRELLAEQGDQALYLAFCELNVSRLPDDGEALAVLGGLLLLDGRIDEAIIHLRQATICLPNSALAWSNLSVALQKKDLLEEAIVAGYQAVAFSEHWAAPHNNLGLALKDCGKLSQAEEMLRRAVAIQPDYAEAQSNLGLVLQMQGQILAAESCFRQALNIDPLYFRAHSNLLFLLNYSSSYSPEYCLKEARYFGEKVSVLGKCASTWQCDKSPSVLRVGFVSGDFRTHPVGYFLESFMNQLDGRLVEVFAYPTILQEDDLTDRLRPCFSAWQPLAGLNDEQAAQMILSDGVHILVDLSGHTDNNRLPMFARKPAPVQVSWLGYFATTGLMAMDYVFVDPTGVPKGAEAEFVESIWRLPATRLCFAAPKFDLDVAALPALSRDRVTFGCFQNLSKINDEVLITWAGILRQLPTARLRLQCSQLDDLVVRARLQERFHALGVGRERLDLFGAVSRQDYLAAHAEVDFLLDTFPYPGGTTTCEALWMGVPTLTLAGRSMLARQGASLLAAAGLSEWVASDPEDYLCKAVNLADDIQGLAHLRTTLRSRVLKSALFDGASFAHDFTVALWDVWKKFATSQNFENKAP